MILLYQALSLQPPYFLPNEYDFHQVIPIQLQYPAQPSLPPVHKEDFTNALDWVSFTLLLLFY